VRRGAGKTIVAGYPWFTDWGRDTFIALRGLCLATGRLDEAGAILEEWAGAVSEGMLPNLFPDGKSSPEFNSVDASLWYLIAMSEYMGASAAAGRRVIGNRRKRLQEAFGEIVTGYARGTRYGIRADSDGLLAAGEPGVQLTWMDAKVGDWVVTPRIGKPVEIQALWINALRIASGLHGRVSRPPRQCDGVVRAALLERPGRLSLRRRGRGPSRWRGRRLAAAEPDFRRRRPPVPALRSEGPARAADRGRRRGDARDAARPAIALAE
jgi:glycogen debranching enzyme